MKEITRVNHIGLRVRDFNTARDFYSKLGFEYITGPSGPEPVAIIEHPAGININLILNAAQGDSTNQLMDVETKHTGYTHVAIEVSDLAEALKHLASHNIPLSDGPMRHPTGESVFIRDPDRNVIEFIEYTGLNAFN